METPCMETQCIEMHHAGREELCSRLVGEIT